MPSKITSAEYDSLQPLLKQVDTEPFRKNIRQLHTRFSIYASTCPVPLAAPGLIVTPEIRNQCECYLPVAEITSAFYKLYRAALNFPPVLTSTPFHNALSWADVFVQLSNEFQGSADPALLLESLLVDDDLLKSFLFASFLPERFYGGMERYPQQKKYVREWLLTRRGQAIRCLDAACGIGEEVFGLCLMLAEDDFSSDSVRIDGWTVEPLEVWAAGQRLLPHNYRREALLRKTTAPLFMQGFGSSIRFSRQNILAIPVMESPSETAGYHIILCNGLLGGPVINEETGLELAVSGLAQRLAPGGMLLAADNFHGGWKRKCPQSRLRALFVKYGLKAVDVGEGIGGLKPDQQAAPGKATAKSHG